MLKMNRKRAATDIDSDSDKENVTTKPIRKRQATIGRNGALKSSKDATRAKKGDARKQTAGKGAAKLYSDAVKAIEKGVDSLDKKVKAMDPNSWRITTSNYATSAGKHMGAVKKLADLDPVLAFNLLITMADASHTDLDATPKMCGTPCDDSGPTFKELDETLVPLIETRSEPSVQLELGALPKVRHRWTRADADVGVFKTGRPNKQQWNQMYRQKLEWEKERRGARRQRREDVEDWVAVALSDLREERDYLEQYGVEGYLPTSISRLEEMVAARESR
jgi:hypothetical protein